MYVALGNCFKKPIVKFYDKSNKDSVVNFWEFLQKQIKNKKKTYMVIDNWAPHRSALKIIKNRRIIPLFYPPYSCRFNPVEYYFGQIKPKAIR